MYGEMEYMELIIDMLDLEDDTEYDEVMVKFEEEFGLPFQECYRLVVRLLDHTPMVKSGLLGLTYNAFVSKKMPVMLMQKQADVEADGPGVKTS